MIILAPSPRADVSEVERREAEGDLFAAGWKKGLIIRKIHMGYELDRSKFISEFLQDDEIHFKPGFFSQWVERETADIRGTQRWGRGKFPFHKLTGCFRCGVQGHCRRECPLKSEEVKCGKCRGYGHKTLACNVGLKMCRNCGSRKHTREDCTEMRKRKRPRE